MQNIDTTTICIYILVTCFFICLASIIIYYQTKKVNAIPKGWRPRKNQIDSFIDTIDPIDKKLPQGLFDTQNVH